MSARRLRVGGRIDRYVGRLFVVSYLAAFLLVVGLYVIVDTAVNLDEYLEERPDGSTASLVTVGRYYLLHLPFLYLEMSPFVTLVAGLFAGARLVRNNEVVAVLGAGVSARRMFAPMVAGGVLLAAGMFALRELATDAVGRERDRLREVLLEQREEPVYEGISVKDRGGRRLRVLAYHPEEEAMHGLSTHFVRGEVTTVIEADRARDPRLVDGRWVWELDGGWRTRIEGREQLRERIARLDDLDLGPEDVELAWRGRERPLDLSFTQVLRLLGRDPDNLQYRTVLQYHATFPLAGVVLLLVGLPFLVGHERGKGLERAGAAVLLCSGYFATDLATRTLGLQGALAPLYAAWLPIVLFGSLGLVLFGSMRS